MLGYAFHRKQAADTQVDKNVHLAQGCSILPTTSNIDWDKGPVAETDGAKRCSLTRVAAALCKPSGASGELSAAV